MASRHPLQNSLGPVLRPFSFVYGGVTTARRALARRGVPPAYFPPRPCISIGNISWGGTGKTPLADWLLTWADCHGLQATVLTRGYGAHPPELPLTVTPAHHAAETGDEPLMLARKHPQATIVVDPKRNRAARQAMQRKPAPDLFLLDDGFQHISTGRHLNLVLLDVDDVRIGQPEPPGNTAASNWNRVLPAGTWREPISSLADADAFLIKADPLDWLALQADVAQRLTNFSQPVFAFTLRSQGLCPQDGGAQNLLPATAISGPYALVCGVGNPAQVRHTVQAFMGRPPAQEHIFADHHEYREDRFALAGLNIPIVCTAKDAVKLETLSLPHLYALEVEAEFYGHRNTAQTFPAWWQSWWNNHQAELSKK